MIAVVKMTLVVILIMEDGDNDTRDDGRDSDEGDNEIMILMMEMVIIDIIKMIYKRTLLMKLSSLSLRLMIYIR